jgi:hypothetical protein
VSGESVVIKAAGIRAVFQRENERWGHCIELSSDSGGHNLVMRSLEGQADDVWPPSPVIQQLEVDVQDGVIKSAMGIGMSGPVHWSLSCYAAPHPVAKSSHEQCLIFEAACRLRGAFERVGTCYSVVPEIVAREGDQAVMYRCSVGQWCATAGAGVISNMNQTLRIDVFDDETDPSPRTVRWAYAINRVRDARQ